MCSCARIGEPAAAPADQRQHELRELCHWQVELLATCGVELAHGLAAQADAARGAADELDHPLARQRLQVLFSRVGGLEALSGDFRARVGGARFAP